MNVLSHTLLPVLGNIARSARAAGLGNLLATVRDASDSMFVRLGTPPLRMTTDDFEIGGYLRHRSFLDGIAVRTSSFFCELFMGSLEPGMTVVDGGACIGLYSLLASGRLGSHGTVMAFEPDPRNFRALSYNVTRNRCANVVAVQRALADAVGSVAFYENRSPQSSSLIDRTDLDRGRRTDAVATTLDHELRDVALGTMLIKIDVEGAEVLALRGMRGILQRAQRVVLLLEIHPALLGQAGSSPEDVLAELERFDFQVYWIDEHLRQFTPVNGRHGLRKGNFYCRRG